MTFPPEDDGAPRRGHTAACEAVMDFFPPVLAADAEDAA
jgi:hypothetical protein